MRDAAQIHDLLDAAGRQHGETGLTAGHNILMVTKNIQCVRGNGSCADVENSRQQFAGNLIHIRNHKEQPL